VRFRDETLGALTLFMSRSGRSHGAGHLAAAQDLAALAATVVDNARLVAQHARAQDALRASEERLRLAVEAGDLGIWDWDIPTDRVTWTDAVYRLHGVAPGAFGGSVADFAAMIHPDDRAAVRERIEAALAGHERYAIEFRVVWPDGAVRWLATHAHVWRDAAGAPLRMVGATYDVTARLELLAAERAARTQAERARHRLELLAAASARLSGSLQPEDTLSRIAEVLVPAVADWCRIDLLEADGSLTPAVTHHADPARARVGAEAVLRLRGAADTIGSMTWCVRTGESHLVVRPTPEAFADLGDPGIADFASLVGLRAAFVTPLVARGRMLGALAALQAESGRGFDADDTALVMEIAQRAALALDNARLYSQAESARAQAERASRAKDEFLAMLGHELRNPLAPIVTTLHVMALQDDRAFQRERRLIERQVNSLARLVDDLLDVARIARGDVQLRRERVLLGEAVGKAVEMVSPLLETRRHVLRLELPPEPLHLNADAARLTQVFGNLLANAARYTPEGGEIVVRAGARGTSCEVAVADNGQGIDPALLPQVFDLFVQGRRGLDRAGGGLGVGLALVKNLVALHGGSVSAHSDGIGRGSEFRVTLPLVRAADALADAAVPAADADGAAARAPADAAAAPRPGRRVLLVDDNRDAAEALVDLLTLEGHQVHMAGDALLALELAERHAPDVAILDIGLPGIDGYELAVRLRKLPGVAACRLVALTGYGLPDDRARSRAAGFEAHLVKPVDPEALLGLLRDGNGAAGAARASA